MFELASLTKLMTALAVLVAVEEESLTLDQVATDEGATVSDLLCHASGMAPDSMDQLTTPGTRRVYSTAGYERLGEIVAEQSGMAFSAYLSEGVLVPLGMGTTELHGSPGSDATSTVRDMMALASAWRQGTIVHQTTLSLATHPVRPRARRGPPRLRPLRPESVGSWSRDQGREGASLDRQPQLGRHLRSFRAIRNDAVDRPDGRLHTYRPHRRTVRSLGFHALAAVV